MSKTVPGFTSEVIDNGTVLPSEQNQANAGTIAYPVTTGMGLRRYRTSPVGHSATYQSVPLNFGGPNFRLMSLFAVTIEDVIRQISILETCNNELALLKTMSDINYLKAVKYGVCDPNEIKDKLDGIDAQKLNCLIYKVKKLDEDRKSIKKTMIETFMSLGQSFNFDPLVKCINSIEELHEYRAELLTEENKNKMTYRELYKQLKKQRNYCKTVLYDTQVIIDKLKAEVEDAALNSEIRTRYVNNWQAARTEQHTQTIFDIENVPATTIEYYKQRSDHESRVHSEVETLVSIVISETLGKVEEWMKKYDTDIEERDLQIAIMKNKLQDAINKRQELEVTYATHEVMMKNWLKFKSDRQDAINYREKMTSSALIAQAWWRGLLVRLELGPYKPHKKPKPKKKLERIF